jgi:F0F1-type ATP synthase membrane subunit b/b'
MSYGRRLVASPALVQRLRNVFAEERATAQQQHLEFLAEVAELRGELMEMREILAMMVATSRAQAETDVEDLRRQLEHALSCLTRRDPNTPLH